MRATLAADVTTPLPRRQLAAMPSRLPPSAFAFVGFSIFDVMPAPLRWRLYSAPKKSHHAIYIAHGCRQRRGVYIEDDVAASVVRAARRGYDVASVAQYAGNGARRQKCPKTFSLPYIASGIGTIPYRVHIFALRSFSKRQKTQRGYVLPPFRPNFPFFTAPPPQATEPPRLQPAAADFSTAMSRQAQAYSVPSVVGAWRRRMRGRHPSAEKNSHGAEQPFCRPPTLRRSFRRRRPPWFRFTPPISLVHAHGGMAGRYTLPARANPKRHFATRKAVVGDSRRKRRSSHAFFSQRNSGAARPSSRRPRRSSNVP